MTLRARILHSFSFFSIALASVALTALTMAPAIAIAHNGATGVVGERMNGMSLMGRAVRTITQNMNETGDNAEIILAAEQIRQEASLIPFNFEAQDVGQGSEALPEIWSTWDDFVSRANALEQAAEDLLAATEDDSVTTTRAALRKVQSLCGQCHHVYRAAN